MWHSRPPRDQPPPSLSLNAFCFKKNPHHCEVVQVDEIFMIASDQARHLCAVVRGVLKIIQLLVNITEI